VSIFKLKFEAHRLVNLLFYGVIFILGFVCGLGIKQIDFNKLIPKILMIENVNALTITTTVDTSNGNLIVFDEEYIYNEMFNNTEYSYEDYSNIICHYSYYVNSSSVGGITCRAFNSIDDFKITDYSSMNNRFTYSYPSKTLTYELTFNKSTGNILLKRVFINEIDAIQSSFAYFAGNDSTSDSSNKVYSNFNFINGSSLDTVNKKINKYSTYIKLILSVLLVGCMTYIYFIGIQKIGNAIFHIYGIISIVVGFILYDIIIKLIANNNKK